MIRPGNEEEQDFEDELLRNAYAEGRKDEREASCVDELVAALKAIAAIQDEMFGGDWEEINQARAIAIGAIAKLEQTK